MRKIKKMQELTKADFAKVKGGNSVRLSLSSGMEETTQWNTLGSTGKTGDEGYDSSCDDDLD